MSKVLIRQIAAADNKGLAEFLSAFPGDERSFEQWQQRFRCWWEENPAFDETWVRGFILTDEEKIAGFVGSFPTLFICEAQVIKAFNGTTWRVLPAYRNHSIDLWIKNREVSNHILSFNTTPTDTVIKLISKLNYRLLPWGSEQESVQILNPAAYSQKALRDRLPGISSLLGVGIRLKQSLIKRELSGVYTYKTLLTTDKSFDDLWEQTKGAFAYTNVRTADTVNWYSRNSILVGIYRDNALQGYAVVAKTAINNLKEMYLADLWLLPGIDFHKAVSGLVDLILDIAKEKDCSLVRFPHFTEKLAAAYIKKGLLHKKIARRNFYRLPASPTIAFTSENSYFSMLQGDYGI